MCKIEIIKIPDIEIIAGLLIQFRPGQWCQHRKSGSEKIIAAHIIIQFPEILGFILWSYNEVSHDMDIQIFENLNCLVINLHRCSFAIETEIFITE
jgi:hypothetical protein